MKKKCRMLISYVLTVALFVTLWVPTLHAQAKSENISPEEIINRIETQEEGNGKFSIKLKDEKGQVVAEARGAYGQELMEHIRYDEEGNVVSKETYRVSDYITVKEEAVSDPIPYAATAWKNKGTIYYRDNNKIVYQYRQTGTDNVSYTINAKKGQTIAAVAGLFASVLGTIVTGGVSLATQIVIGIAGSIAGGIVGDTIEKTFTTPVAAQATYYDNRGKSGSRYTKVYKGTKLYVTTKSSSSYKKTFYEGDATPDQWKNTSISYWMYCDLFDGNFYPAVQKWV